MLQDETDDILLHVLRLGAHLVIEVGTVEGTHEVLRCGDAQILFDVLAHLVRRRGREGNDGRHTDLVDHRADAAVLGTEVVAPFRDTVGLIHGIEGDLHRREELGVLGLVQTLGRHIEQLGPAGEHIVLHFVNLSATLRRVEEVGHAVVLRGLTDGVHLILHQGDERRDHDGRALHHKRRQLVAQTLAAARRHQHESVVAGEQVVDDGLLIAFEGVKAEVLPQCLVKIDVLFHSCVAVRWWLFR